MATTEDTFKELAQLPHFAPFPAKTARSVEVGLGDGHARRVASLVRVVGVSLSSPSFRRE